MNNKKITILFILIASLILIGIGATYDEINDRWNNPYYETNKQALMTAFGASNCTDNTTDYNCSVSGLSAGAFSGGSVDANGGGYGCYVDSDGSSNCYVNGGAN